MKFGMIEMSGAAQHQLDRVVIDLGDRTFPGLAGRLIDQSADARRHRVAGSILVAPAGQVEDHVIGVKASPLFQVTSLRTCSTYSVASSLTSQLSRRTGSKVNSRV